MTYKQQDDRLQRRKNKSKVVDLHTLDKEEYAQKLLEKFGNGDKMKPEGKQPKVSKRKPGIPPDPYINYDEGVCSGCHEKLLRAPNGRIFHRAGVSPDCQYGSPDYTIEKDVYNHGFKVTVGGVTKFYSFFDFMPEIKLGAVEMNVPEWCFFDLEFV